MFLPTRATEVFRDNLENCTVENVTFRFTGLEDYGLAQPAAIFQIEEVDKKGKKSS